MDVSLDGIAVVGVVSELVVSLLREVGVSVSGKTDSRMVFVD